MRRIASRTCDLSTRLAGGLGAVALVILAAASGPAVAQSNDAVVVELYTSQGCSSCPPADEFMAELAGADQVIALALHVDYWDYIGWEDSFAKAEFTERQKAYARAEHSRMIYTPQMIVGGVDRVEGNAPDAVVKAIGKHRAMDRPVRLWLERQGDAVIIRALADPPLARGARVQLVRYIPSATVTIDRGENAGRTVAYRNIVTAWQDLGDWPGQAPLELKADAPGPDPVVVIVQEPGPAAILAAAAMK